MINSEGETAEVSPSLHPLHLGAQGPVRAISWMNSSSDSGAFCPRFAGSTKKHPKVVQVVCFNPGFLVTGNSLVADDWYYTQSSERKGPVSFAKLQTLAKSGWLTLTCPPVRHRKLS